MKKWLVLTLVICVILVAGCGSNGPAATGTGSDAKVEKPANLCISLQVAGFFAEHLSDGITSAR